jgi:hypothetical protein
MARVKRGVVARARHKKVLKQAKGYYGARRKVYRVAKQAVIKAGQYAYRDRRQRKRSSVACGSSVSTRRPACPDCLTAALWMASTRQASKSIARCWPISQCMT